MTLAMMIGGKTRRAPWGVASATPPSSYSSGRHHRGRDKIRYQRDQLGHARGAGLTPYRVTFHLTLNVHPLSSFLLAGYVNRHYVGIGKYKVIPQILN